MIIWNIQGFYPFSSHQKIISMSSIDTDGQIVFVVGNSRSGTTLMGSILGNGPDVFTFEELHFFDHLRSSVVKHSGGLSISEASNLAARLFAIQASDFLTPQDPALFSQEAQQVAVQPKGTTEDNALMPAEVFRRFLSFKSHQNGKSIPCEQTPQNVFHIQELLDLYPNCRIVNMVRDPRDVLLSQKYKWRIRSLGADNIPRFEALRSWANYHSVVISKLWNASIQAAHRFEDHARVRTVRFEDLVLSPEAVLESVCDFAGVRYVPEMLNVSQSEGGVSSHKKISPSARGIDSGVVSKWKRGGLLPAEIFVCQAVTRQNMAQHGYSFFEVNAVTKGLAAVLLLSLPFKLSLAILFNLKRMGNWRETLKKRLFS